MYNTILKETIMFVIDTTIDAIQTGQKTIVKTFVQNESIAESMINFIDFQSDYTKKAAKATTDAVATFGEEVVKSTKDLSKFDYSKFDYSKFGETFSKFFQHTTTKSK